LGDVRWVAAALGDVAGAGDTVEENVEDGPVVAVVDDLPRLPPPQPARTIARARPATQVELAPLPTSTTEFRRR
jgi:hypothetical protein